ncbi:hypothetical protein PGR6_06680 [Pseudomonas sp. GR 6-02]|nr:hypothetical protein PGR6_06680 [Pseudomonas sp. GR 6-02]
MEQAVDNPFMAGAAPCLTMPAAYCSFFDQLITRKTGA